MTKERMKTDQLGYVKTKDQPENDHKADHPTDGLKVGNRHPERLRTGNRILGDIKTYAGKPIVRFRHKLLQDQDNDQRRSNSKIPNLKTLVNIKIK